ncbi:tetratricopeptide repeat protein, partial [Microcoleus sp. LEGE 07076]|uniref:tetratricopeptide repeat protein n=1 Tax=Microcoleus sp. LEGE 07076 TaxID=915322 RepID=UPI001880BA7C
MDEQSLNAYLNLVNALLTCPSGQEGEVLSANQELIDAHLVHIMEQVAEKLLVENGNENSAIFLQNLANKIAGLFANLSATNSEEYFKFLLNLLQAISDSDANLQVVYPILQANIDKLNAQLVEVLQTWGSNYLTELLSEEAQNLASALCDFGNLLQQFPRGHRADNLEIAIVSYQTAMIIFNQKSYPIEWAMTHINLGSAYTNRICGEKAENVEKAISAFCCALTVITPISFSRDWATCQINLGRAYYNRIKGVRGQNLENTIVFYQAALQVYNRQNFPDQWASLQNSLGNAYSDRIIGDRAENVEIAINYYQSALQVYTCENFPDQWATTQNNLGTSYNCRILGKRLENLEQAIHCYQDALQIRTREAFPQEWAATQNNLAAFYSNRIQGDRSENLEMAISCYENVLEVYSIEAFPYDWAMIQNNLGNAYSNRIRGDKVENLERAIACFNAALQIRTRDQFPENWAISQNNLGTAYSDRLRGDKADNLERAIACFKAALEVYTRSAFPQNHAETLLNLGLAYRNVPQLQLAYDTFDAVINTVEFLRSEIRSGDETKQKLAEKWNKLYLSMVEVCLGIGNYTKGMEYAERSKAYNLVELLTTRDLYPKRNLIKPISFSEIQQLLIDKKTIIIEWYVIEDK